MCFMVTVQNILEDLLDKSEFYKILALRFANFYGLKSRICSGTEQIRFMFIGYVHG